MLFFHQHLEYHQGVNMQESYWALAQEIGRRLEAHGVDFQYALNRHEQGDLFPGIIVNNRLWIDADGYGNTYDKPLSYIVTEEELRAQMEKEPLQPDYLEFKRRSYRSEINAAIEQAMQSLKENTSLPDELRKDALETQLIEAQALGFDVMNIFYHETEASNAVKIQDEGFKLTGQRAGASDSQMPHGVFVKPDQAAISVAEKPVQIPVLLKKQNVMTFEDRAAIERFIASVPALSELQQAYKDVDDKFVEMYDAADAERANAPSRGTPEAKEWRTHHFAELDRILTEWKAANLYNATLLQNAFTEELQERGIERLVIKNDEGSFGRSVTTVLSIAPDAVMPASTDFTALKEKLERQKQGYVLPGGYRGIDVSQITQDSPEWDHLEDVAYSVEIGFSGPHGERLSSLIYDGERPVGAAWSRVSQGDQYSFDIAVVPDAQGNGIGRHMIDRALAEYAEHKRYIPGLKASFYIINEDLADAMMRRGFIITEDLADRPEEFVVDMGEAPEASKMLERAERKNGSEFDVVYGNFSEAAGLKYDFQSKYTLSAWVDKPENEDVKAADYPAVIEALDALPLSEFEKTYMKTRAANTYRSLPKPELENTLDRSPALMR